MKKKNKRCETHPMHQRKVKEYMELEFPTFFSSVNDTNFLSVFINAPAEAKQKKEISQFNKRKGGRGSV